MKAQLIWKTSWRTFSSLGVPTGWPYLWPLEEPIPEGWENVEIVTEPKPSEAMSEKDGGLDLCECGDDRRVHDKQKGRCMARKHATNCGCLQFKVARRGFSWA